MTKLSQSQILKARNELGLMAAGDGWVIFNQAEGTERELNDMHMTLMVNHKAICQIDNIIDKLEDLCESLDDFVAEEFDEYIDAYSQYREEGDPPFDPYDNITFIIGESEYDALPDEVETYIEMVSLIERVPLRRKAMDAAFEKIFKDKLERHFLIEDEETGETTMVAEKDMDPKLAEEFKTQSEVNQSMRTIEIEHCFDNYNQWIAEFRGKIKNRSPFQELRDMIGD